VIATSAVEGVEHGRVRAGNVELHYAEAGRGEDVVICLHGWPQNWFEWRHLMPSLADRHRVLALDLRGFGSSDAPRRGYEKEQMANDVLAAMDTLGIERAKLVGHDWGAWIGFLLCLREPRRFERFLALATVPPWPRPRGFAPHAWRFLYQLAILTPGLGYALHRGGDFVRRAIVGATADREIWDEATLAAFADPLAEPERARAAVQLYRTFNLREVRPVARGRYADRRLTVPTRLVNGLDDPVIRPSMLAGQAAHADELEIELVEGCGHFVADERPDLVAERARALFA